MNEIQEYISQISDILIALVSCFVGGWAAIKFQERSVRKSEIAGQIVSARLAQLALYRQFNYLSVLRKELVTPFEKMDDQRVGLMPAMLATVPTDRIDRLAISFLFDEKSHALMAEVLLAEDKFLTIVEIISKRNDAHNFLQNKFAPQSHKDSWELNRKEFLELKGYTDSIIEFVPETIAFFNNVFDRLHKELKSRYPDNLFFKVKG